jgi:predicted transcriptional regulator
MYDGMLIRMTLTSHRTTFALDAETAVRLKKLAALWHVSQAEVVRRAIAQAERAAAEQRPDPVAMLQALQTHGEGLDRKSADAYLDQIRKDRRTWWRR